MINLMYNSNKITSRLIIQTILKYNYSTNPSCSDLKPSYDLKKFESHDVSTDELKWRTPWHQQEATYYSTLRTFYSEENQTSLMKWLQTPIDLRPSKIKNWLKNKHERKEIFLQSYIPERNQTLGDELAAAHFIVYRGGAVKFHHEDKWIKCDENQQYDLPKFFDNSKYLQGIDCSNVNLYYEGLVNFTNLKKVEWLRFNYCKHFDDWFLDKISNLFSHSLIYLDIRHCPKFTERGLCALYKMKNLKILCIDDMLMTTPFEMTCIMLQEHNPYLDIKIGNYI